MQISWIAKLTGFLSVFIASTVPQNEVARFRILPLNDHPPSNQIREYRSVPDFSLTERSGRIVSLVDLHGKIWIADFIYTECTDTCPLQTVDMAKLQEQWMNKSDLELVSFSVDPGRDTPRVLSRYASRFKADPTRWLFLTGSNEEIARLIQEGFHLAAAPARKRNDGSRMILHSPRFVLVDRQGQIRGYYDNRDPKAIQRLKDDVESLLTDNWRGRSVNRSASERSR